MLVHKRRSKKFYTALQESTKKSKESNNVVALAFDYIQNLQLPKIPVQDLFNLRQLTVRVFCIHNMKTDQVVYFIYHEGCGKKGPNEVCSFLYQFIKEYIPKSVRKLRLFSDNCPGQNKNNYLIRMCLFLKDSGRFNDIQQYFPIRGHSFLPCDRDFGNIKRKLKKVDCVNTIRQYIKIIASSSNKHKFLIHLVDGKDIVNFKDWWLGLYKKTAISIGTSQRGTPRDRKVAFTISNFHQFSFCKNDGKGVVLAKHYINGFEKHTFYLGLSNVVAEPKVFCYLTGKLPIKSDKMNHIKKSAKYVNDVEGTKEFWDNIFSWPIIN
ncbi:unnamed protein product [Psylliodes chrysocephalus]|uniref:DUF7869 domain-containing protein n=1 Tax=Psylliodes chrysocephalus TaxID=3402493 RepID=A0A9P0G9D4_9CUCU|nr:unnamed protein product [Psylliodes chrysocephala]